MHPSKTVAEVMETPAADRADHVDLAVMRDGSDRSKRDARELLRSDLGRGELGADASTETM